MPEIRKTLLLTTFLLLLLVVVKTMFGGQFVYADDPCKDIKDLDDKAECYEDEIEEKEEKYESTSKKLSGIRDQKNEVTGKIEQLLSEINVTQAELNSIQAEIDDMNARLDEINNNLTDKRGQLEDKIKFRNKVVREYTKKGILNELELFMASKEALNLNGFQFSSLSYMFEKSLNIESVRLITIINEEILNFEEDKKEAELLKGELETAQASLLALISQRKNEKSSAEGDLNKLEDKEGDYEEELKSLSEKIDDLNSKQQEILKKKFGDSYGSVGDYESPTAKVPDPPFKPAFGAFSYGAYTHYRGMSQYGAKGRAKDGKDYKEIIKFYYKEEVKKKDDFPSKLNVDGHGELKFQYYLYGIAEMPSDWPMDALKAQAIAARTYAYRFQKQGKSICTSQSCQVFLKSKADNPPDRWKEAVDETKGKIIGGDTHAMYSSTTGGYIDDGVGWDKDGSWPGDAYEKKAKSPWFYWAWYSSNYRFDSDKCGRSHPWLDSEEMADILNAWVVWNKGNGDDRDRITPVTTSCWGGNPFSEGGMADRADDLGTRYSKVTDVDVDIGNNGRTSKVTLSTDKGKVSIDGEEFKTVFNLRAPGYVSLRSRLYDFQVEK